MPQTIQLRRGTAAQWTAMNPVLAAGEMGTELDTGKAKVGDGTKTWVALSYTSAVQNSLSPGSSSLAPSIDAVNAALTSLGAPGLIPVITANDITSSRALTATDFDGDTDTASVDDVFGSVR